MSTATSTPSTASRHFTPEQIECAIRGVVRRSTEDEDEAALITKRMRRVLNGEVTVEEVSGAGNIVPKHVLEAYVKAAQIVLDHIVDGIAEAIAAFKGASIGEKSNDAAEPGFPSSMAENRRTSSTTLPSSNTHAEPSATRPSETAAAQPAPRSGPVTKAPRPWGPLSKRKPTLAAEGPSVSPAPATENLDDKTYLEVFSAPDWFVDIDAEMQARVEDILAKMCDECGKAVTDLKRHKQDVHSVESQKRYTCEKCPAVYAHERSLQQHTKEKHARKSKGTLALPSEHDGDSDDNTTSVIITDDLVKEIANFVQSTKVSERPSMDPMVKKDPTRWRTHLRTLPFQSKRRSTWATPTTSSRTSPSTWKWRRWTSSMELDLHLSDASDPVVDENMEDIHIMDNNNDGRLFSAGHQSVGKNDALGQDYDGFVDIVNVDGEDA